MYRCILLCMLLLRFSVVSVGQPLTFTKSFFDSSYYKFSIEHSGYDPVSLIAGTPGSYYATAEVDDSTVAIMKFDSTANIKWRKSYRIPSTFNVPGKLIYTYNNQLVFFAYDCAFGPSQLLTKLDTSGNVLFTKAFSFTQTFLARDIAAVDDGGLLLAVTASGAFGTQILRLDSNFNVVYQRAFKDSFTAIDPYRIASTDGINFRCLLMDAGSLAGCLIIDKNCLTATIHHYGSPDAEHFVLEGTRINASNVDSGAFFWIFIPWSKANRVVVSKLGADGKVQWSKSAGLPDSTVGYRINMRLLPASDGGVIATASFDLSQGNHDAIKNVFIRFSPEGDVLYQRWQGVDPFIDTLPGHYFYSENEFMGNVLPMGDTTFLVSGSGGTATQQFYIARVTEASNGWCYGGTTQLAIKDYQLTDTTEGIYPVIDLSDISTISCQSLPLVDSVIPGAWAEHCDSAIIFNLGVVSVHATASFSVAPNPATDQLVINCSVPDAATVSAKIFSITGKLMLSQMISAGQTTVPVSSLPSGMYMCKLMVNGDAFVEKIVIDR